MKKRVLSILIVAMCGIQLAACGKSADNGEAEANVANLEEDYEENESNSEEEEDLDYEEIDDEEDKYANSTDITITWSLRESDEVFKDFTASCDGDIVVLTQDNRLATVAFEGLENEIDGSDVEEIVSVSELNAIVKNTDGTYSVYDTSTGQMKAEHVSCPNAVGDIKCMYYSGDLGLYVYSLEGTQLYITGTNKITESWPVKFYENTVDETYTDREIEDVFSEGALMYFVLPDKTMLRKEASTMTSLELNFDENYVGMTVYPTNGTNVEQIYCAGISTTYNVAFLDSSDTANIKLDSMLDGESSVALPDGYTTADIKEAYFGYNNGCVIFDDGNIYLYVGDNFDSPEFSEDITSFYADGDVQKICPGKENIYFLMDDGKIYEIF